MDWMKNGLPEEPVTFFTVFSWVLMGGVLTQIDNFQTRIRLSVVIYHYRMIFQRKYNDSKNWKSSPKSGILNSEKYCENLLENLLMHRMMLTTIWSIKQEALTNLEESLYGALQVILNMEQCPRHNSILTGICLDSWMLILTKAKWKE